jgi:hypothetical protein
MPSLLAIYRSPSYSPLQHLSNDIAILDAAVAHLVARGWDASRLSESEVESGRLPVAELYLNMAQGPRASELLTPLELDGAVVVNAPSSVLHCHRHRLVRALAGTQIPFPRTVIVPTQGPPPRPALLEEIAGGRETVWIKRGDVHAERPEDVISATVAGVPDALRAFAARGLPWAAIQRHVGGPILKFYAVADGRFFRWYAADAGPSGARPQVNEQKLEELAFEAAETLGLDIFGGDVAVPDPAAPVLIDINDWPSFAPYRDEAARAIADYIHSKVESKRGLP